MPSRAEIADFLASRHLAFVGASRDPKAFANTVYRELRRADRTLYPVNERAEGEPIEGDPSYTSLADVPDPVDGVVILVPAEAMTDVVDRAVARGIPRVWLHRGAGQPPVPPEAVARGRDAGLVVIDGACPLMFDEPVHGIHRFHRGLVRRRLTA